MRDLFEHTSASWVHYSDYEWKEKDGQFYLLPTKDAVPKPYDPMKEAENIVLAAMDIGMMLFRKEPAAEVREAMLNIKLMFSLMLTDENAPLRLCRECAKPFIAPRSKSYICSPACREKHKNKRQ